MIDDEELSHLIARLESHNFKADVTETKERLRREDAELNGPAELLRLFLWRWVDERDALISPPMDRRSVAVREHLAARSQS